MMIQQNISAPSTVLDFPTRHAFTRELTTNCYDIVGISSIIPNIGKVREMCRLVREHSPGSVIVVGGHVTAIPDIDRLIDADHIVKGDGISWMRRFLGEDAHQPIRHAAIVSGFGHRIMGLKLPRRVGSTAATIIPSVEGWRRYKNHPDRRIRKRFEREASVVKSAYSGLLWAMERQLKATNAAVSRKIRSLRQEMEAEFGLGSRLAAGLLGPLLLWTAKREEKRLADGQTYEPKMFIERRNWNPA